MQKPHIHIQEEDEKCKVLPKVISNFNEFTSLAVTGLWWFHRFKSMVNFDATSANLWNIDIWSFNS